jgi:hypothetical protein
MWQKGVIWHIQMIGRWRRCINHLKIGVWYYSSLDTHVQVQPVRHWARAKKSPRQCLHVTHHCQIVLFWQTYVGHNTDCLIRRLGNWVARDFVDRAGFHSYRYQNLVSWHTLEIWFRVVNEQESLLPSSSGVLFKLQVFICPVHLL